MARGVNVNPGPVAASTAMPAPTNPPTQISPELQVVAPITEDQSGGTLITATPTEGDLPLVIPVTAVTGIPEIPVIPTSTLAVSAPTPWPQTPVPQDALIRIYQPATGSRLISPLHLLASVSPGDGGNVHLRVIDESGQEIIRKDWLFNSQGGRRVTIDQEFEFKVEGLAESARLILYTQDAQGRIIALATEELLLLSLGETRYAESLALLEPFQIAKPVFEQYIHHGKVPIFGIMRSRVECLVKIELIDPAGNMLGSLTLPERLMPAAAYQPFGVTLEYQVKSGTWARLTFRQVDPESGTDLAVYSIPIKVYP